MCGRQTLVCRRVVAPGRDLAGARDPHLLGQRLGEKLVGGVARVADDDIGDAMAHDGEEADRLQRVAHPFGNPPLSHRISGEHGRDCRSGEFRSIPSDPPTLPPEAGRCRRRHRYQGWARHPIRSPPMRPRRTLLPPSPHLPLTQSRTRTQAASPRTRRESRRTSCRLGPLPPGPIRPRPANRRRLRTSRAGRLRVARPLRCSAPSRDRNREFDPAGTRFSTAIA